MARQVISDEVWAVIEPLLLSTRGKRGGQYRDHRTVVEGIAWRFKTGSPWRDLPGEFGPWQTAWKRHAAWSADGTWDQVVAALQQVSDEAGELDWTVSVDSSMVRAHQHAAGARAVDQDSTGGPDELHDSAARAA